MGNQAGANRLKSRRLKIARIVVARLAELQFEGVGARTLRLDKPFQVDQRGDLFASGLRLQRGNLHFLFSAALA